MGNANSKGEASLISDRPLVQPPGAAADQVDEHGYCTIKKNGSTSTAETKWVNYEDLYDTIAPVDSHL